MGGQKAKKSRNLEDQNVGNTETESTEYPRMPNVLFFLFVGFMLVLGLAGLHLLICGIISFILGIEFITVIYVTTAALVTGGVILMATSLLTALSCILTFFVGMQNVAASKGRPKTSPASRMEDLTSAKSSTAPQHTSKND